MKIWRVTYATQDRYTLPPNERRGAFVVAGDSLASVEEVIRKTLAPQTQLFPIRAGECLGDVIT